MVRPLLRVLVCLVLSTAQAAPLTGRLLDSAGQPVAGARVLLVTEIPAWRRAVAPATTAADGGFSLSVPDAFAGHATLLSRVPGRGAAVAAVVLPAGAVDLRLRPGESVDGVVLDPQRRPLAGAVVAPSRVGQSWWLGHLPRACAESLWRAETDAEGRWRLDDLPQEWNSSVLISATGCAMTRLAIGGGFQPSPGSYMVMAPAGTISGRVAGPDGAGRPGLCVVTECDETVTDAEGRYELTHASPGERSVWLADDAQAAWVAAPLNGIKVAAGARSVAPDLRLVPAARAIGRVRGGPGVVVDLAQGDSYYLAEADIDGRFVVTAPPGCYRLAAGPRPLDRIPLGRTIELRAGQTLDLGELGEQRESADVVLRDEQGQPLRGATVWVASRGGRLYPRATDADGILRLEGTLPAGRDLPLTFVQPGPWRVGRVVVIGAGSEARLSRRPATALTGRVVDETGRAVPGATVALSLAPAGEHPEFCTEPDALTCRTDADGRYRFAEVPTGWSGQLRAGRAGYRQSAVVGVEPLGQALPQDLTLLRLAESATGRVIDRAGRPVAGAMVLAQDYQNGAPAITRADGTFVCSRLPSQRVTLWAMHGRRAVGRVSCVPTTAELTIRVADAPAVDWSQAPTADDIELARGLVMAALGTGRQPRALALLARIDPAAALERVAAVADPTDRANVLRELLSAAPPEVRFGEGLVSLVRAAPPGGLRPIVAALAAAHLPSERRDLTARLAELAKDIPGEPDARALALQAAACRVELALRAGQPNVDAALADLDKRCLGEGYLTVGLPSLLRGIDLQPRLVALLLANPYMETEETVLPANDVASLLQHGDARGAYAAARRCWPPSGAGEGLHLRAWQEPRRARLLARLVAALVNRDPTLAQSLVTHEGESDSAFAAAMYAALTTRDKDLARWFLAAAARLHTFARLDTDARVALAAAGIDDVLVEGCRQDLLGKAVFMAGCERGPLTFDSDDRLDLIGGHALALSDPNRTRWAVESRWAAGCSRGRAAVAMAAVDRGRAVEMARSSLATADDRLALACWLLADRRDRSAQPLSAWFEYNAVWPGLDRWQ
ncbi:MAG: carboxypeptidase regulatory-like domain-containing protein [Armatimonadetes bacterium]|nr:carboxypeptidase regulatory-like domain-containing protein [Armatimonadota bacterium]